MRACREQTASIQRKPLHAYIAANATAKPTVQTPHTSPPIRAADPGLPSSPKVTWLAACRLASQLTGTRRTPRVDNARAGRRARFGRRPWRSDAPFDCLPLASCKQLALGSVSVQALSITLHAHKAL